MTSDWETVRLGELCTLTKGKSPTLKTEPGDYPLIVTGPAPLSSVDYQFDGEAVCVPMVSSTGHGHASLKRVHYASGKFAVANIITACEVVDPSGCDTKFLAIYLQHFKDELIVTRMQGTANVSLSQKVLATVPISLPPLPEQRRIVDLIGALDAAIEAADCAAETARVAMAELRQELIAAQESNAAFEDVATLQRGFDLPVGDRVTGIIPVIASSGPVGAHNVAKVAGPGVVTGRSGTIGIVQHVSGDFWPLNTTLYVKDFKGNDPSYVRYLLETMELSRRAGGSTVPSLNRNVLREVQVFAPNVRRQQSIAKLLDAANASAFAATTHAASLHTLRSELLTALLSGTHAIPESYDEVMSDSMGVGA